jgi:hypothetical protein
LIPVNNDYTEIIYDRKEHHKKLVGLVSRQYDPAFFQEGDSESFKALFEKMNKELFNSYSK